MSIDLELSRERELSPQPPQSAGDDLEILVKKDGVTAEDDADCELAVDEDYEIFRQYLLNLADAFQFVAEFLREQSARPPGEIKCFFREFKRRKIDGDIMWFKHAKTRVETEGRSLYEIWDEWPAYKHEKTNADGDSETGEQTVVNGQSAPAEAQDGEGAPEPMRKIFGAQVLWLAHAVQRAREEGRSLDTIWDEHPFAPDAAPKTQGGPTTTRADPMMDDSPPPVATSSAVAVHDGEPGEHIDISSITQPFSSSARRHTEPAIFATLQPLVHSSMR